MGLRRATWMGAWPGDGNQVGGKSGQGSWPEGAGVALPSARRSKEPAIPWLTEKAQVPTSAWL